MFANFKNDQTDKRKIKGCLLKVGVGRRQVKVYTWEKKNSPFDVGVGSKIVAQIIVIVKTIETVLRIH